MPTLTMPLWPPASRPYDDGVLRHLQRSIRFAPQRLPCAGSPLFSQPTTDKVTFPLPNNFACHPRARASIMIVAGGVLPRIQEPAMRRWFAAFVLVVAFV